MPIYQTAHYKVRPESLDKCLEAIREFTAYVKENEPHTRVYTALQEVDDATGFVHFFIFEDEAAHETHSNSEAVAHFSSVLYPETLDGVRFVDYNLVATN